MIDWGWKIQFEYNTIYIWDGETDRSLLTHYMKNRQIIEI